MLNGQASLEGLHIYLALDEAIMGKRYMCSRMYVSKFLRVGLILQYRSPWRRGEV